MEPYDNECIFYNEKDYKGLAKNMEIVVGRFEDKLLSAEEKDGFGGVRSFKCGYGVSLQIFPENM